MTEHKDNCTADSAGSSGEKNSTQIRLTFNDLMVLGFNMVKSGFGLIQSFEKVLDSKFQEMVDKGELKPDEASRIQSEVKSTMQGALNGFSGKVNDGVKSTLNRLNIATLQDIQTLESRLDSLLQKVDELTPKAAPKAATTRKKSTPKRSGTRKTTPKASAKAAAEPSAKNGQ